MVHPKNIRFQKVRFQNVRLQKCPRNKTFGLQNVRFHNARLQNVRLQNLLTSKCYKTSVFKEKQYFGGRRNPQFTHSLIKIGMQTLDFPILFVKKVY
jgi:hypothetical protein